jgi:hypothetical protein
MPTTLARTATTDMEVTSIRLERDLKEKLKDLSTNQGYQALIRDILWIARTNDRHRRLRNPRQTSGDRPAR